MKTVSEQCVRVVIMTVSDQNKFREMCTTGTLWMTNVKKIRQVCTNWVLPYYFWQVSGCHCINALLRLPGCYSSWKFVENFHLFTESPNLCAVLHNMRENWYDFCFWSFTDNTMNSDIEINNKQIRNVPFCIKDPRAICKLKSWLLVK